MSFIKIQVRIFKRENHMNLTHLPYCLSTYHINVLFHETTVLHKYIPTVSLVSYQTIKIEPFSSFANGCRTFNKALVKVPHADKDKKAGTMIVIS